MSNTIFQRPAVLYVNPTGASRRWEAHTVTDTMTCEFRLLKDIDGDGAPEFIFKRKKTVRADDSGLDLHSRERLERPPAL